MRKINKAKAVREAIMALGMDAPNSEVFAYAEKQYGKIDWGVNPAGIANAARKKLERDGFSSKKLPFVSSPETEARTSSPTGMASADIDPVRAIQLAGDLIKAAGGVDGSIKIIEALSEQSRHLR